MTLISYEGFDFAANGDAPEATWIINGGTWTYVAGRIDGRAVSVTDYIRKPIGSNAAGVVAGVAWRRQSSAWPSGGDTAMNYLHFLDGTTKQIEVRAMRGVVSGHRFQIWRGTTLLATSADQLTDDVNWFFLAAKIVFHATDGSIEVSLNNVPIADLTLTGIPTIMTANPYATHYGHQSGSQGGTWNTYFDDSYVCDLLGPAPYNTFLGDVHVETIPLDSDVAVQWTPSTGDRNYALLDDLPMTAVDYVSAAAIGLVDEYSVANLATTPAAILAAAVLYNIDKDDIGTRVTIASVKSGGIVEDGAQRGAVMNVRRTWQEVFTADPATGAPWTPAAVNGVRVLIEPVA